MRFLLTGFFLLTACASHQTTAWQDHDQIKAQGITKTLVNPSNRSLAGDNPMGRTHELFGDCTRKTLNEALDYGSFPYSYAQVDTGDAEAITSYDMPNESHEALPLKNATKMQVVYVTHHAAKDGLQFGSESQPKYKVGDIYERQYIRFLLEDGTSKNDCKIIDTKGITREEALAMKPANAHAYFQDPCALVAVNTANKYFIFHDPGKGELPGKESAEMASHNYVTFRQSYRVKDKSDKSETGKRFWMIMNVDVNDSSGNKSPMQARMKMEKSGDTCKLISMETRTGWEKAE